MRLRGDEVELKDPELLKLAWELLAQEWETLKKMCQIAAMKGRRRGDTWEEAMSELTARLPQFLWTYDPSCGRSLKSHVIGSARWYLYKHFVSERGGRSAKYVAEACKHLVHDASRFVARDDHGELFDWSEVQYVLDRMHPFHRQVLKLYYMVGFTYEEIAGVLECSKSAARKRVIDALAIARRVAGELGGEDDEA